MNPTTVQNVVTYDAIIDFANPLLQLFPGMTAYVTIPVATVRDVVKVPNAALRFKPPLSATALQALYAKYAKGDPQAETAIVWKLLANRTIVPVKIGLGITDHAYTEVTALIAGDLKAGDDVVTTAVTVRAEPAGAQGLRR
jgi:HlyD family secretion protein